jgi:hypothetical protein
MTPRAAATAVVALNVLEGTAFHPRGDVGDPRHRIGIVAGLKVHRLGDGVDRDLVRVVIDLKPTVRLDLAQANGALWLLARLSIRVLRSMKCDKFFGAKYITLARKAHFRGRLTVL